MKKMTAVLFSLLFVMTAGCASLSPEILDKTPPGNPTILPSDSISVPEGNMNMSPASPAPVPWDSPESNEWYND